MKQDVWVCRVQEVCDSSAGYMTFFVLTKPGFGPDVHNAYRKLRSRDDCSICEIDEIRNIGCVEVEGLMMGLLVEVRSNDGIAGGFPENETAWNVVEEGQGAGER